MGKAHRPRAPPTDGHDHDEPPPGYEPGSGPAPTDVKKNPYHEDRPAVGGSSIEDDAKLAARLQAEEGAKARGGPQPPAGYGEAQSYHAQGLSPHPQEQYPQDLPPRERDKGKAGGFLGKLFGKGKAAAAGGGYGGHSPQPPQQGYYQAPPQGHYQPQQQYAGYANQGPPMGGYGGSPGFGQQRPQKRPGMGGMGMGLAGGALGLGAGMLGGALIADAVHDHDHEAYMEGYGTSRRP